MPVVSARPGHTLPQAWGRGLGLDLHTGHLRQRPDPAAGRQDFAISLGLGFLISVMGL